jgi:WhiB family redox-sensing transcriptional regulator
MSAQDRIRHIADRLDRLAQVSTESLAETVTHEGACIVALTDGDPPLPTGDKDEDRELATRLCSGCPIQEQCLELELRWTGERTVGVFGALPEDDRRALYPIWRARRKQFGGGESQ